MNLIGSVGAVSITISPQVPSGNVLDVGATSDKALVICTNTSLVFKPLSREEKAMDPRYQQLCLLLRALLIAQPLPLRYFLFPFFSCRKVCCRLTKLLFLSASRYKVVGREGGRWGGGGVVKCFFLSVQEYEWHWYDRWPNTAQVTKGDLQWCLFCNVIRCHKAGGCSSINASRLIDWELWKHYLS